VPRGLGVELGVLLQRLLELLNLREELLDQGIRVLAAQAIAGSLSCVQAHSNMAATSFRGEG